MGFCGRCGTFSLIDDCFCPNLRVVSLSSCLIGYIYIYISHDTHGHTIWSLYKCIRIHNVYMYIYIDKSKKKNIDRYTIYTHILYWPTCGFVFGSVPIFLWILSSWMPACHAPQPGHQVALKVLERLSSEVLLMDHRLKAGKESHDDCHWHQPLCVKDSPSEIGTSDSKSAGFCSTPWFGGWMWRHWNDGECGIIPSHGHMISAIFRLVNLYISLLTCQPEYVYVLGWAENHAARGAFPSVPRHASNYTGPVCT